MIDEHKKCDGCDCALPEESIAVALMGPLKEAVLEIAEYYGVGYGDVVATGVMMLHEIMKKKLAGELNDD